MTALNHSSTPFFEDATLQAMLNALPVGALIFDAAERVLFINEALGSLTGLSIKEAYGLPCRHVLRAGFCPPPSQNTDDYKLSSCTTDCITRQRRKIPIRLSRIRLPDTASGSALFMNIVEDLSAMQELENRLSLAMGYDELLGHSPAMTKLLSLVPAIGGSTVPLLITGETGSGKTTLAKAIHKASGRASSSFVRFSCGPMPPKILDCELFGRCTSENEIRPGRFQQAQGGTLYLAEIADLPIQQQKRLVRFLDEGLIEPSEGKTVQNIEVRLLASTSHTPEDLLANGKLQEDLFHRLAAIRLHIPPLRERPEDISLFFQHFMQHYATRLKKKITGLTAQAKTILQEQNYPGNVRELKNIAEFAVMVCPEQIIDVEHFPPHLAGVLEKLSTQEC